MKITVLNNLFAPYERGGAEKVVAAQIASLRASGHEVLLITTKPPGSRPKLALDFPVFHIESQFYSLGGWPVYLRIWWHLANVFSWRKYREIKAILAAQKPDLVISHNLMGLGFLIPLAIRRLGLSHEHWLHDIQLLHPSGLMLLGKEKDIDGALARIYQAGVRRFFASPQRIVSPSRWLLEEHKKRGFFPQSETQIKTAALENSPAVDKPDEMRADRIADLLFVGQVESHKGVLFLVRAFRKLAGEGQTLMIVGDGGKMAAAKRLAGNDPRIIFRGRLSGLETKKAMATAAWLVVPSLCYENYPTVIREAHAVGLPIIAAAIGGIPETVSAGDKLFKAGDEKDLIAKISSALRREAL